MLSRPVTGPSIAAVIPLYNGARFIEESLGSVLAQTLPPDEIIVVDDGSTDEGPSIVERFASHHPITLLRKSNGGQSSARNYGVAHSKSELIALLDQDDAWYSHHLAELVKPFREKRAVPLGWVYSDLDEIDEGGFMVCRSVLMRYRNGTEHPKRSLHNLLRHDLFILPSASLISRKAFEHVQGFDVRLSGYEDDDLFLRLFRAGYDNVFVEQPLSKWRIYPSSCSFSERMGQSRLIYVDKLLKQFADHHFAKALIATRFLEYMAAELSRAILRNSPAHLRQVCDQMSAFLPNFGWKRRLAFRLARPLLQNLHTASLIFRARRFLRFALR